MLLAEPPAKRDDKRSDFGGTHKMSGKKRDSRRSQNYTAIATAGEFGKPASNRAKSPKGYSDLKSLANGLMETHDNEEKKLFSTKYEVSKLLEGMLKSKEIKDEV